MVDIDLTLIQRLTNVSCHNSTTTTLLLLNILLSQAIMPHSNYPVNGGIDTMFA